MNLLNEGVVQGVPDFIDCIAADELVDFFIGEDKGGIPAGNRSETLRLENGVNARQENPVTNRVILRHLAEELLDDFRLIRRSGFLGDSHNQLHDRSEDVGTLQIQQTVINTNVVVQ